MISTDQIRQARILVVDDQLVNVQLLEYLLGASGYVNVDTLRDHYTKLVLVPAGIPNDPKHKFHCLRRTLGSELKAKGGLGIAKEILGHSAESVTLRYIDPRYESRPQVPELVPDPLPPDSQPGLSVYREEAS